MTVDRGSLASPLHCDGQGQEESWADGPQLPHERHDAGAERLPRSHHEAGPERLARERYDAGAERRPRERYDAGAERLAHHRHKAGAGGTADSEKRVPTEHQLGAVSGAGREPHRAKLCLKARPTPAQLADRLRPVDGVWPDGLELYLAAADLATPKTIELIAERTYSAEVPQGFVWLIEGPVDSLDGLDFDVTRASPADLKILERLAQLAEKIGAQAVNIHVISPSPDPSRLTLECRETLLERALPFLARFVALMHDAGTVPTVENMPPVLRMRRDDFSFTPIGMASEDLRWLAARLPGLRLLPDTSHAGLYLNARRLAPDPTKEWSATLAQYLKQLPAEAPDLVGFLDSLQPHVENAQISNAAGVLGEGLPYAEGDFDLDPAIRWLGQHAQHIVTEPLEPNNDDARIMRDALRRMRLALA